MVGRKETVSFPCTGVIGMGAIVLEDGLAGVALGAPERVNTASLFF